jgi:short-subunit dehydrogenase
MSQKWALVTGASGGLGTALCQRLAAEGYALCLVDRSQQKSTELRLSLPTGTPAESIIADLSDPAQVQCVCERIAAWEQLALVINNAGVSTSGDFLTLSGEAELTSLRVNMEALYRISRAAAARMCEQGHGTLINIASIVAFQPIPGWTTYAATKAFVLSFTEGLAHELRGSGVRVVAVCPGFTKTNLYAA